MPRAKKLTPSQRRRATDAAHKSVNDRFADSLRAFLRAHGIPGEVSFNIVSMSYVTTHKDGPEKGFELAQIDKIEAWEAGYLAAMNQVYIPKTV